MHGSLPHCLWCTVLYCTVPYGPLKYRNLQLIHKLDHSKGALVHNLEHEGFHVPLAMPMERGIRLVPIWHTSYSTPSSIAIPASFKVFNQDRQDS